MCGIAMAHFEIERIREHLLERSKDRGEWHPAGPNQVLVSAACLSYLTFSHSLSYLQLYILVIIIFRPTESLILSTSA